MATQTMGSHGGGSVGVNPTQMRNQSQDPISNPLDRQGSLYNLTFDEVQNQLGDLGKPLSSMNLDELLKTVWTAEANNQAPGGVDYKSFAQGPTQSTSGSSLNRQSSLTLSGDLSKKTVDEVWQDIQQGQKRNSLDRKTTLGEMTLEDFLVKAGVVAEPSPAEKGSGSVLGVTDPRALPQQAQWMSYQFPLINPQQQQQQNTLPVFLPGRSIQQPIPIGGNLMIDAAYPETQITMSTSPLMGTLSDTQAPGRKRVAPDHVTERTVERRQKRMIKNRESAARSRARKQAYTHELENKISRLEEENERLRRQKELEVLPSVPPPEQKYQLRRTSSAPI
ncbi:ABSCISIC ACID-INSENSITIVE 5-like protein 2 [Forsythia ovata]|uniref:ABSCISIC ACID-INSENSITIVE 5-like protein 2 n=1 Tax=Forsythia ovata TaxID=205694 RepID=A0ABD1SQT3_9LAMI